MNKTKITTIKTMAAAIAVAGMTALTACGTSEKATTLNDINGEWIITEAGGKPVSVSTGEKPFIGFNVSEGRVYGYLGCNRLTGALDKNMTPGKIDLSKTGSTRMMCPDMSTEDLIMSQMGKVESYKKLKGNKVVLTDGKGNSVIILERKDK